MVSRADTAAPLALAWPVTIGSAPSGVPGDVTLNSYEAAAHVYLERSLPPEPPVMAYLNALAGLVGTGTVLELGSGPGWDADYLQSRGPGSRAPTEPRRSSRCCRRPVTRRGCSTSAAITLKEGDGEAWTQTKLDRPRHFTYWREPAVRAALLDTGWQVLSLEHVAGRVEPWLFVIARTGQVPAGNAKTVRRRRGMCPSGLRPFV